MKKLILLTLVLTTPLFGAKALDCSSERLNASFSFSENSNMVAIHESSYEQNREIASVSQLPARTKMNGKEMTKVMNYEGNLYTIYLSDHTAPSENRDTISIKNSKGHEVTYPLACL